jgi:hypothetical protein
VRVEHGGVGLELPGEVAAAVGGPGLARLEIAVPQTEVVLGVAVEGSRLCWSVPPACPRRLAGGQPDAVTTRIEGRLAVVHGELRLPALDVDTHHGGSHGFDETAGGLDLEDGRLRGAGSQDEAAGPQAEHDPLVPALVVIGVVELAAPVEPDGRALGELELDTTSRVGPHPVAGEEGKVRDRLLRRGLGGPLQGHAGLHLADVPVAVLVLRRGRGGTEAGRSEGEAGDDDRALPHGVSTSGNPHGSRWTGEQVPCRVRLATKSIRMSELRGRPARRCVLHRERYRPLRVTGALA